MKTRLLLFGVVILFPLGLGLWARSAASWRPQKIGNYVNCFLVNGGEDGPWLRVTYNRALQLDDGRRAIYLGGFEDSELHFSPDGRSYAVSLLEKNKHDKYTQCIELHKASSGKLLQRFRKFLGDESPHNFRFSLNGANLIISISHGVEMLPLDGSKTSFFRVPHIVGESWISPDGKWMCIPSYTPSPKPGMNQSPLRIYNVQTGRLSQSIKNGRSVTVNAGFSPDASLIWVSDGEGEGADRGTWLCDARSGRKLWDCPTPLMDCAFSADSKSILLYNSISSASGLAVRDARTGKLLRSLPLSHPIREATFSGDGSAVYAIDDDDTVWKVRVR